MKKIILLIFVLLSGCAQINNPYDDMSPNQLSRVSSNQLCETSSNSRYKSSDRVLNELVRRGYKDCSASELFCRENLSLKPGTEAFANCRIKRDQYYLNESKANMEAYYLMRQLNGN